MDVATWNIFFLLTQNLDSHLSLSDILLLQTICCLCKDLKDCRHHVKSTAIFRQRLAFDTRTYCIIDFVASNFTFEFRIYTDTFGTLPTNPDRSCDERSLFVHKVLATSEKASFLRMCKHARNFYACKNVFDNKYEQHFYFHFEDRATITFELISFKIINSCLFSSHTVKFTGKNAKANPRLKFCMSDTMQRSHFERNGCAVIGIGNAYDFIHFLRH